MPLDSSDVPKMSLQEANEHLHYVLTCQTCRQPKLIDLEKMIEALGADYTLGRLDKRWRCRVCGSKQFIITVLWKSGTSTAELLRAILAVKPIASHQGK